ncbi:chord-domain-containing protein [Hysterangium stoloniferum]|nr:chord-domain-containing protein [Hysterangium stoloniferum]
MPKCMRKGCGLEYDEQNNTETSCHYHSGAPVFHEGLKSWSCCSDVNRPVLDFDSFMAIRGCTNGPHTEVKPKAEPPTSGGVNTVSRAKATSSTSVDADPPLPIQDEEDDTSIPVIFGTPCKRRGCGVTFNSEEESRIGEGEGTVCTYHPSQPIFREGSKGYLCCKRRVLEFDEFLKIKGCKTGKHLFVSKQSNTSSAEELVTCRIDHYQTPSQVHVSVFAKQTDKAASVIQLEDSKVHLDLVMPASKRFKRTLDLYGPITPDASKYTFFGTKVEIILEKADTRSWLLLEKTDHSTTGYGLTFGVGGRTGTVGGKELILSEENKPRTSQQLDS